MDCSMSSYYEKMLATGEVKCIDVEIPLMFRKVGNGNVGVI